MYKIRKIKFDNHPILKNLELDFCDKDGRAFETIILAGENGTGKSTIINSLYEISSHSVTYPLQVEIEKDGNIFNISYYLRKMLNNEKYMYVNDRDGMDSFIKSDVMKNKYPFNGIFSDVDINFHANAISTVTSLTLDSMQESRRSTEQLPTEINQLLVDIQSIDDGELARAYRKGKEKKRMLMI